MSNDSRPTVPWWQPVLFAALAGGMGWGIRGQYGHETGAMVPGLLVCLTLVFLMYPRATSLQAARAVAFGTIAMGFGGQMTYGQTLGLTQNAPLIGHWGALSWGLLGCLIKGGIWIGFAGVFLGMGMGGVRYRARELVLLMLALVGAYLIGKAVLNTPHDIASQQLPPLYFSYHWYWEPGAELAPRPERWGGLLFALLLAVAYTRWWRNDSLAWRLALWGVLGGALGFPIGQSLQAYHAWNIDWFQESVFAKLDGYMNWWNMMETTFGATMGAFLGLGVWVHRKRIKTPANTEEGELPVALEWALVPIHIALLLAVDFLDIPQVQGTYDIGIVLGVIPMIAVAGGRWWPYLLIFPVTLPAMAGKTVRDLVLREETITPALGWFFYVVVPAALTLAAVFWFVRQAEAGQSGRAFTRRALLVTSWLYFWLNFAIFRFPWPWAEWTGRTPSGIIFTVCLIGLTALVLANWRREEEPERQSQ